MNESNAGAVALTDGLGLLPERAIAECMLAVENPLFWGRLGADSKGMVLSFARAVERAAVAAERERWEAICREVMAEHGGDPAGQLLAYGDRDRLVNQCQAAGASQVLFQGIGA